MTTQTAIKIVEHLQHIKQQELLKYKSAPLFDNLAALPFNEVAELVQAAKSELLEDRINQLKKSVA